MSEAVLLILHSLPYLAPELVKAILAIAQAPSMTKEELLSAAEDLDDQTLALIKTSLGE